MNGVSSLADAPAPATAEGWEPKTARRGFAALAQGPGWVKTALLAFLFFLLFQFAWTGAGKISSIYRQYREFQEWRQNVLPPNPFDGDGNREGISDFIKRHFPRGASRTESEEAARIFADAADRVESGELINEDDLFGYLAENLRPVCLSAGWPDFLDELWARAAQASIGSQPLAGVGEIGSQPSAVAQADATAKPGANNREPRLWAAVAQALRDIAEALKAAKPRRAVFGSQPLAGVGEIGSQPSAVAQADASANELTPIIANPGSSAIEDSPSAANEPLGPAKPSADVIANPGSGSEEEPEEPDARIETEEPDNQDAQRDTANAPSNISEERTRARELPANYGGLYWW